MKLPHHAVKSPRITGSSRRRRSCTRICSILATNIAVLLGLHTINAATYYWDTNGATAGSGAATGNWDGTAANWTTDSTGATVPAVSLTTRLDDLIFSAGTNGTTGTVAVSGAQLANSITFDDNVAVTLSGATASITLGGGGTTAGIFVASGDNAANTISTPILLDASTSTFAFTNNGTGLLTIGAITGSATSGTQTINIGSTSSGGITLNGIIGNGSGGGAVALVVNSTGSGVTTLSGVNTFSGGLTISQGTVSIAANTALGGASGTAGAVTINGGILKETSGSAVTNTHPITIGASGGTINVSGKQYVFNTQNTLLGSGTLTIVGGAGTLADGASFLGNLALNAANTYTGNIIVQAGGSLELNNNAAIGSASPINVNSNGELIVDTNINVPNALAVNGGELTFNNGNNGVFTGNIALSGTGATVRLGDFYQATTNRSGTITGNISGTGGLTLSVPTTSAVTLTLTGANTYTGNTTVVANTTLVSVTPNSRSYVGVISGAGAFTKSGPGALTLTGANTYTGTTTVSNGTLNVGDGTSGVLASTALTFSGAGGTVNFNEAAGSSQGMGVLTFSASEGKVQSTYGGSGNTILTFSNVAARTAGAVANFVSSGGTNGSTNDIVFTQVAGLTPTSGTLLDKGFFFNGSSYAAYDAGGFVRAFGPGDTGYVTASGSNAIASTSTNNVALTGAVTAQATASINTLNMGVNSLALASGGVFQTNGILESGSSSATISGGTSLSSTTVSGELVIRVDLSTDNLTISTPIINNTATSLTKSGAGTLTLTGANTYTGATTINAGKVSLTGTATLAATAITMNAGSTLEFAGTTNSFSGLLTINGGNVNILSGTVTDNDNVNNNVLIGGANTQASLTVSAGATFTDNPATAFIKIGANTNSIGIVTNAGTMTAGSNGANLGGAQGAIGVLYNSGTFSQPGAASTSRGIYVGNGVNTYGYIYNTGTINITSLLGLQRSDGTTNIIPGSAVLDMAGGTINIATQTAGDGQGLKINSDGTSDASLGTAQLNITGGTLNVGTTSAGTVTVNNTTNTYSSLNVSGASAIFNLMTTSGINLNGSSNANNVSTLSVANGGTLNTSFIDNSGSALSTGVLSLNNATLKATAADATALIRSGVSTFVEAGGATIDNGGFNVIIASALKAPTGNGLTGITLGGVTTGFVGAPVVVISGGGGTGAAAIANFDPTTGTITGFTITSPGSGYTSAPTITLYGGNGVIGSGASIDSATTATASIGAVTSGAITYQGAGTTTLTSASTYTGGTTITAGTLAYGVSNALADTGVINVNGGTLGLGTFSDTVGAVILNSGAITGSTGVLSGSSYAVKSGSVSAILAGSGSALTKSTAGSVILSGANTYTGATLVNGGTLTVSGAGSINNSSGITINGSGAKFVQTSSVAGTPAITLTQGTLDGTGTVGAVTVGAGTGGIVTNGNGSTTKLTLSSLTFTGAGTLTLNLLGGASNTEALTVTNAFTTSGIAGSVTVNVAPLTAFNNTTYNLIGYGSFSGNLSAFVVGTGLTSRQNGTFGTSGNFLTLTISGDAPKWTGLDNNNWVVGTTGTNGNWKLIGGGGTTDYIEGDTVLFDDSATGTTTVDIANADVSPTLTTFNNSTKVYVLESSGGFGILNGGITKNGTGKVTITNANGYAGVTAINAGSINIQNDAALGATSNVVVASGAALELQGGISVDARPLTISGAGLTASPAGALRNVFGANSFAGLVTLGANSTIQSDAGSLALTNAGTITGSGFNLTLAGAGDGSIASIIGTGTGSVIKNGAGTWTLSGSNTYTGGTIINGGTLIMGNASALGAAGNTLTFGASGNGTLTLNGNSLSLPGLSSDSTATINNSNATAATLTINKTSGTDTFAGTLADGTTGILALIKSGAGTWVLSGTNTFSGATTLSAGTLQFNGAAAMSGTSALTMSSGTTLSLVADADTTFSSASLIMNTGGTNNFLVNSLNSPAGDNHTLTIVNSAALGNGTTTINVTSTTGDTLKFGSSFGTSANNASAWGGPVTTFNLTNANVILTGLFGDDGQLAVSSTTGNTLTINGNVATSNNRTLGATVNSGTLTLNNTVSLSGTNQGFFVNLNGGTLNINAAGAIRNNSGIVGTRAGLAITGGTLDNTSGTAITLSFNPTVLLNGDFAFSTAGSTSANDLNLGTGVASLGPNSGTARTITTNGSATLTLGGAISNGTTATGLTKAGTGTLTLTGANAYTGTTTIAAGTLFANNAQALNTTALGGSVTFTGGTLKYGSTFAAGANADISSRIKNSTGAVAIDTNGQAVSYASAVDSTNTAGLTKSGNGTLTLAAANTYTGTTTVSAGELIVSGSLNGTANVNVASGATLASAATGSIATSASGNIAVSGTLAPGDFGSVGTLTLAPGTGGKLSFLSGSTLDFTISGANSDQVSFSTTGDWLDGSGNVTLSLSGITAGDYGNTYTLFHNVSTGGFSFANITGYDSIDYTANFAQVGSDYQLSFSAIPEPSMPVSLLGGVGVLFLFRRRGGKARA